MIHESEFFVHGVFIGIAYSEEHDADEKIRNLLDTLKLILHRPHLQVVPNITVGNRPPRGGGGAAIAGMPGGPYIRLNRSCFNSRWNRGYNYTLLHEVGHIIDWTYRCMTSMRREDNRGYRTLLAHPHLGATQGDSEHYADAYADYFISRPMSDDRRRDLLASRAFVKPFQTCGRR